MDNKDKNLHLIIDDLRRYLGNEMFEKVGSRLMDTQDDTDLIAVDDLWRQYCSAQEGFSEVSPDVTVRVRLKL